MSSMKSLSLTVQKLQRRLKLTTDRQTNKQTDKQTDRQTGQNKYAPDHSIRGHKKGCESPACSQVLWSTSVDS